MTEDRDVEQSAVDEELKLRVLRKFPEIRDNDCVCLVAILQSLRELDLGFDFKVLAVLDDERATPAKIEALKDQLGNVVSTCLFSLANSVYYGKIRSGNITKFVDVVKHLGTDTTKIIAIFVALLGLAETDDLRVIFARNFATGKLAEFLATQLGLSRDEKNITALGGLFVEMGDVIIRLYEAKSNQTIESRFVATYHAFIGTQVIENFELPASLCRIIDHSHFVFDKKDSFSSPAIVDLAHAVVNESFQKYGKLVIQSALPDPEGVLYNATIGSIIAGQFSSVGLSQYVSVLPREWTDEERRILERAGRK